MIISNREGRGNRELVQRSQDVEAYISRVSRWIFIKPIETEGRGRSHEEMFSDTLTKVILIRVHTTVKNNVVNK